MTNVTPGCFVDSNILVYAFDAEAMEKREQAERAIGALVDSGLGVISTQVLSETFSVLVRKKRFALDAAQADAAVRRYVRLWPVLEIRVETVLDAMQCAIDHKLSYYDALIWATAKRGGLTLLLSEDGQHDRVLEGVRYLNPFAPDFDLAQLS
jgi:predicted nucleic acid-binding protein